MAVLWVGGSSALCRTYMEEVGPQGRPFVLTSHEPPTLEQRELEENNPLVRFVQLDLLQEDSVRTVFERIPEYTPPPDALRSNGPPEALPLFFHSTRLLSLFFPAASSRCPRWCLACGYPSCGVVWTTLPLSTSWSSS